MLHLMWIVTAYGHLPTYGGCIENCCPPPRPVDVSQVIYLKGSGGLEVHLDSDTSPFNILENEEIDVDAVFREPYDTSTYSLYVGCGGCVCTQDDIVIPPMDNITYESPSIEPFTQTGYWSIFDRKKFDSGALNSSFVSSAALYHTSGGLSGKNFKMFLYVGLF
jgi:hypothetical protein